MIPVHITRLKNIRKGALNSTLKREEITSLLKVFFFLLFLWCRISLSQHLFLMNSAWYLDPSKLTQFSAWRYWGRCKPVIRASTWLRRSLASLFQNYRELGNLVLLASISWCAWFSNRDIIVVNAELSSETEDKWPIVWMCIWNCAVVGLLATCSGVSFELKERVNRATLKSSEDQLMNLCIWCFRDD